MKTKEQIIETLEFAVNCKDNDIDPIRVIFNKEECKILLQALTSVKSESAEEYQVKEFNYYPLFIQKKPYKALLSIQTLPFFKIIYKDKEITTEELCDILMELPNEAEKKQHAIGFDALINESYKNLHYTIRDENLSYLDSLIKEASQGGELIKSLIYALEKHLGK